MSKYILFLIILCVVGYAFYKTEINLKSNENNTIILFLILFLFVALYILYKITEIEGFSVKSNYDDLVSKKETNPTQWNILKWNFWDIPEDLEEAHYCKVQQFNDEETCVPISDPKICSASRLFRRPVDCLKSALISKK